MEYAVYKLYFNVGVHFGNGTLADSEPIVHADTLFSALCHEAIKHGGNDSLSKLVSLTQNDSLVFSDCMPYVSDELFIPKPLKSIVREDNGNSSSKKAFKKLTYISVGKLSDYLAGGLDPLIEVKKLSELGKYSIKSQAAIRGLDESMPYSVGVFTFNEDNGLYFIVGFKESDNSYFVEELLQGLSYSGIGGKTSAGFGKFDFQISIIPKSLENRLNETASKTMMTISSSMATKVEIKEIIEGSNYLLVKRSGFVSSDTYSENPMKKRDFYLFKAGSCFTNSFKGDVFDVSAGGKHPVYRYAKPMLIGVE